MKLIKLTSIANGKNIYVNPELIGHIYEVEETKDYNVIRTPKHTVIGVTTHNNGGFKVKETPEQIFKMKPIEMKGFMEKILSNEVSHKMKRK
jgi:hypothetical protein